MSEHIVPTRATQVTLFEDRAEVVRAAQAVAPAGQSTVHLGGISALVDDPSVVARLVQKEGGRARVLSTQVLRRVRQSQPLSPGELAAAEEDVRRSRARREEAERALERAKARLARCDALFETWLRAAARVPRRTQRGAQGGPAGPGGPGWLAGHGAVDRETSAALDEVSRLEQALVAAREDEARAALRLREGRRLEPRNETTIAVQLEAEVEGPLDLELTYRVPCALWRPEHVARLAERPGGGHEIGWQVLGTAWQRTGEEWRGVMARFSTARPGKAASPPLLSDDVLYTRKKTEAERRTVVVEAREQAIAVAGLGRGATEIEEMPGVEDGGEPLTFTSGGPVTIPSDGQPFRVELLALALPCQVDLIAYPERTAAVHLRATATLSGGTPILAGPVRLLRGGEVVGASRVGFVGRGEPFEIGFGVDDGLRVRRAVETQRDSGMLGGQKVAVTVRLYVSNLSGAPRRLTVTERLPVSEIEDVKVALTQNPGGRLDERDGFLRCDVELGGGGERELVLGYRIEAGAKVQLPF